VEVSKGYPSLRIGLLLGLCMIALTGCALVKPDRHYDEATPIDWGLENSFEGSITVTPFEAQDEKWGVYAAKQLQEHLLESQAFRRVVYSGSGKPPDTQFVLKGDIEYIYYGGTHSPSKVCVSVKIIDTRDGKTRFLRVSRMSSGMDAFHLNWLSRVYLPSPYPEELLNAMLVHIADDISQRTVLIAKKCP
jgi:hypothetical protein